MPTQQIDLSTFKPSSAKELLDGLVTQVIFVAGSEWKNLKKEISTHLQTVAKDAFSTQVRLQKGEIDQKRADFLIHMQELYMNNILLQAEFLTYAMAQAVLNGIFSVVRAVIKNLTGIDLNF